MSNKAKDTLTQNFSIKNIAYVLQQLKGKHDTINFADLQHADIDDDDYEDKEPDNRTDFLLEIDFADDDVIIYPHFDEDECNRFMRYANQHFRGQLFMGKIEEMYSMDAGLKSLTVKFYLHWELSFDQWHKLLSNADWLKLITEIYRDRKRMENLHDSSAKIKDLYVLTNELLSPGMQNILMKTTQVMAQQ